MSHGLSVHDVIALPSDERAVRLRVVDATGSVVGEASAIGNQKWELSVESGAVLYRACWALAEFWSDTTHASVVWANIAAQGYSVQEHDDALIVSHGTATAARFGADPADCSVVVDPAASTSELFAVAAAMWVDYQARAGNDDPEPAATGTIVIPVSEAVAPEMEPVVTGADPSRRRRLLAAAFVVAGIIVLVLAVPGVIDAYQS